MSGKLKFVKRGGSLAATLAADDVGAYQWGQAAPSPLDISRTNDLELPSSISIVYQDVLSDYQQATQISKRMTGSSMNAVSLPMPMTLTAQKAKQVADVNLFNAWSSRTSYTLTVTRKWSKLEPTDVIDVPVGSVVHRMRITKKDDSKSLIKLEAVFEDLDIYTQSGTGASLSSTPVQTVLIQSQTIANYLDLPCLTDSENDAGFYIAAAGVRAGWGGCTIFKSADDGATYSVMDSIVNQSTVGYATTTLGDFLGGNIIDEINSITIILSNSDMTLSSVTESQLLNKSNAALIGNEIIQFRDATLIATNTYTLTGLLRGRKGTERSMGSHAASERFIALSSSTTWRAELTTAEIGLARTYKVVTIGMTLQQTSPTIFTNTAEALECYSPIYVAIGLDASNNATINWKRRNRLSQEWRDYADVPQSEATESYTIEIYATSAFAVLKRTLTSATPTVAYSAANQVTDFGANQNFFNIRIYQSSAINGLGRAASYSGYALDQMTAYFYTDFNEYAIGVAPTGFTEQWNVANFSEVVQENGASSNSLKFTITTASKLALSLPVVGSPTNVEILQKFKPTGKDASGATSYFLGRSFARCSGAIGSEAGYYSGFAQNLLNVGISKYVAGTSTLLGSALFTFALGTVYMSRFQVRGTSLKLKVWASTSQEPTAWVVDIIDSAITSAGWCGIGTLDAADDYEVYEITATTWA